MTLKQFRSVWTTTLATFLWTKIWPGISPTIWLAGTRLSEQPIQRYSGFCCSASVSKKPGSEAVVAAAHSLFLASRWLIGDMAFGEGWLGGGRGSNSARTAYSGGKSIRHAADFCELRLPVAFALAMLFNHRGWGA